MSFEWSPLSAKQEKAIALSTSRTNIWEGAVRSGKTVSSIVRWLEYLKTGPPGKKLIIGKTERTVKRNLLDVVADIVGEKNFNYNRGMGEVTICGHKCEIASANDERSESKIRGLTLAGAYGDEVSIWPESFFTMLLSRLSVAGAKFFGTTNPEGPFHWLKENYIDREDELDLSSFHFLLEDNLSLSQSYIENLKKEYVGVWYRRYILGEWCLAEGLIYDMFDEDIHVVKELPSITRYWVGVDYGTSNATAFILLGLGADGNLYICDEYKHAGTDLARSKTDAEYSKELQKWLGDKQPEWIFVDPSAKSFRTQLYRDRKKCPALKKVYKANNDVLDGIRNVASLLAAEKLFVFKKCTETIKEFSLYSWDEKAQERGEDKPIEKNDHAMDGLRYAVKTSNIYEKIMKTAA